LLSRLKYLEAALNIPLHERISPSEK